MKEFRIYSNLSEEAFHALRDIDKYNAETRERIKKAVRQGTSDICEDAKHRVPVKSGDLKASIGYEMRRNGSQGVVYAKSKKAHLLEFGTGPAVIIAKRRKALKYGDRFSRRVFVPAKKAKPFMRPAIESKRPEVERMIMEAVEKK